MKIYFLTFISLFTLSSNSEPIDKMDVIVPFMDRPASHRLYADELLKLALSLSAEKYGPYHIIQQQQEVVVDRQLVQLQKIDSLSVATSMPTQKWLDNAQMVPFPIMKGLASYRMFFTHSMHLKELQHIQSVADLKLLSIGQGIGWSTAEILQQNGFKVSYGVKYSLLFPMLYANRFHLLMRSIYEIEPEWQKYNAEMPELRMVENFAVYTYLPMYFFVNKKQPKLAQRLLYGLKLAFNNGQLGALYQHYFGDILSLLNKQDRKVFYLTNNNIDPSFFSHDKPYLLNKIVALEVKSPLINKVELSTDHKEDIPPE